jgi:hypothetical protein
MPKFDFKNGKVINESLDDESLKQISNKVRQTKQTFKDASESEDAKNLTKALKGKYGEDGSTMNSFKDDMSDIKSKIGDFDEDHPWAKYAVGAGLAAGSGALAVRKLLKRKMDKSK